MTQQKRLIASLLFSLLIITCIIRQPGLEASYVQHSWTGYNLKIILSEPYTETVKYWIKNNLSLSETEDPWKEYSIQLTNQDVIDCTIDPSIREYTSNEDDGCLITHGLRIEIPLDYIQEYHHYSTHRLIVKNKWDGGEPEGAPYTRFIGWNSGTKAGVTVTDNPAGPGNGKIVANPVSTPPFSIVNIAFKEGGLNMDHSPGYNFEEMWAAYTSVSTNWVERDSLSGFMGHRLIDFHNLLYSVYKCSGVRTRFTFSNPLPNTTVLRINYYFQDKTVIRRYRWSIPPDPSSYIDFTFESPTVNVTTPFGGGSVKQDAPDDKRFVALTIPAGTQEFIAETTFPDMEGERFQIAYWPYTYGWPKEIISPGRDYGGWHTDYYSLADQGDLSGTMSFWTYTHNFSEAMLVDTLLKKGEAANTEWIDDKTLKITVVFSSAGQERKKLRYDVGGITVVIPKKEEEVIDSGCETAIVSVPGGYVNAASGNLSFDNTVIVSPHHSLTTDFTLTFNSKDATISPCGRHFTHTYYARIIPGSAGELTFVNGTGSRTKFISSNGGNFSPVPASGKHSVISKTGAGTYLLTEEDGTKYYFSTGGKLTEIEDRNSNRQTFSYTDDNLTAIIDSAGRTTSLEYTGNRLSRITDLAGNQTGFAYDATGNMVSIIDPLQNTATFTYDVGGNLISKTDANGNTYSYQYDDKGKVIKAIDPQGNQTTVTYLSLLNQTAVLSPSGNETVFTYDKGLNVWTEIIDPSGNTVSQTFDENRNQITSTDANGNTFTYIYDDKGNVTTLTDPAGNQTIYTYNQYNQVLTSTDQMNQTATYEYDAQGNLTKTIDASGNQTISTYDTKGNLISTTDPKGNTTTNVYDQLDNLIQTVDSQGNSTVNTYDISGNLTSTTDPKGNTTTYQYDQVNRLVATIDSQNNQTTFSYDANGNKTSTTDSRGNTTYYAIDSNNRLVSTTSADGKTTIFSYDADGRQVSKIDPDGNITTYTYDNASRLISTTDPQGNSTSFSYDPNGNRISTTDPRGNTTAYTYDSLNRIEETIDPAGSTTSYVYDAKGRIVSVTDPKGTTSYQYDALDRITQKTDKSGGLFTYTYDETGNLTSATDPKGSKTTYTYDSLNRITSTTDPTGAKTSFTYDSIGNLISRTDNLGNTTTYTIDSLNRVTRTTNPDGSTISYTYDQTGNLISTTDSLGRVTTYQYDSNNRLIASVDPAGRRTTYSYDGRGNRTGVTDSLGRTTTYTHDSNNRVTSITDITGATTLFAYDPTGNLISRTDPNGNTVTYQYNALNQKIKDIFPDGLIYDWTYDTTGNILTKTVDGQLLQQNTYDNLNRPIQRVLPAWQNRISTYEYDSAGNRIRMREAEGTTTYQYDQNNRLTGITDPDGGTFTFEYDSLGRRTHLTYPNGCYTTYCYDAKSQTTRINTKNSSGLIIDSHSYSYDLSGNRTTHQTLEIEKHYSYDNSDQIIQVDYIYPKEKVDFKYSYDLGGNRLSLEINTDKGQSLPFKDYGPTLDGQPFLNNPVKIEYIYNTSDQMIQEIANRTTMDKKGKAQTIRDYQSDYNYDPAGNLTTKTLSKGNEGKEPKPTTYNYDYQNLLTQITYPDGSTNSFQNCRCGPIRRMKQDSTGTTKYLYDFDETRLLHEADSNWTSHTHYTLGPSIDEILKKKELTEDGTYKTVYYHYDGLGSVTLLTDEAGQVVARYDYAPFGQFVEVKGGEAKKNPFTYTGREYDRDSGLYYNRARYNDSRLGRFTTVDPILREAPRYPISTSAPMGGVSTICGTCGGPSAGMYTPYLPLAPPEPITYAPPSTTTTPPLSQIITIEHPYIYCKNNSLKYKDPKGKDVYIITGRGGPTGTWVSDIGRFYQTQTRQIFMYFWTQGGELIKDMKKYCDKDAILIGHSFGGSTALGVAWEVHKNSELSKKIKIKQIILLDPVTAENDAPPGPATYNYPTVYPPSRTVINGAWNAPVWDDPDHDFWGYWEHTHIPCRVYGLPLSSCD